MFRDVTVNRYGIPPALQRTMYNNRGQGGYGKVKKRRKSRGKRRRQTGGFFTPSVDHAAPVAGYLNQVVSNISEMKRRRRAASKTKSAS